MKLFNNFLEEEKQEEPVKIEDLHIVILGKGDQEGTFADLIQDSTKKIGMKSTMVEVDEAFISSKDIEIGEVTIRKRKGYWKCRKSKTRLRRV
jgi:hypothetical protein